MSKGVTFDGKLTTFMKTGEERDFNANVSYVAVAKTTALRLHK